MSVLLFANWLKMLDTGQQVLFTISIVSITLCTILLVLKFSAREIGEESKSIKEQKERTTFLLILMAVAGGVGLVGSFIWTNIWLNIGISLSVGLIVAAFCRWLFGAKADIKAMHSDQVVSSTGRVVQSVPPHRNGFGRVFLNIRDQSVPIDAITAGQELPKGAIIKVVEVLDEQIVLVESVNNKVKERHQRFKNDATRTSLQEEIDLSPQRFTKKRPQK